MKASINIRSSRFSFAMRFIFSCCLYGCSICINSGPKLPAGGSCTNGGSYNYMENLTVTRFSCPAGTPVMCNTCDTLS